MEYNKKGKFLPKSIDNGSKELYEPNLNSTQCIMS